MASGQTPEILAVASRHEPSGPRCWERDIAVDLILQPASGRGQTTCRPSARRTTAHKADSDQVIGKSPIHTHGMSSISGFCSTDDCADSGYSGLAAQSIIAPYRPSLLLALQCRQLETLPLTLGLNGGTDALDALHGRGCCATDDAVEPVIVRLVGGERPLIHRPAPALGADAALGRRMLAEGVTWATGQYVRPAPTAVSHQPHFRAHLLYHVPTFRTSFKVRDNKSPIINAARVTRNAA